MVKPLPLPIPVWSQLHDIPHMALKGITTFTQTSSKTFLLSFPLLAAKDVRDGLWIRNIRCVISYIRIEKERKNYTAKQNPLFIKVAALCLGEKSFNSLVVVWPYTMALVLLFLSFQVNQKVPSLYLKTSSLLIRGMLQVFFHKTEPKWIVPL